MLLLCTREHVLDLLLQDYVAACEEQNSELVARTIEAVSGEIRDRLAYRYPQPWPLVPELVRYIASVISAYRVACAITSLVNTEASTDNEWLPLQRQWQKCEDLLAGIVAGRQKLPLPEANPDREDASVAVASPDVIFDFRGF